MHFNVCLACGKGKCRCSGGLSKLKGWAAPTATLRAASGSRVSDQSIVVFGKSENFKTIWGEDPDWALSLETF